MGDVLGWATILLGAVVVLALAYSTPRVGQLLGIAFLLRAFAALVHYYVLPLPDSQYDAIMFERLGAEMAERGWSGIAQGFTSSAFLYSWIIAVLYKLVARSPLMIQGVNVLLGTLIVYNVFRLRLLLWKDQRVALYGAWLAAFWPTLILYAAITMREAFVVFFMTLGVYHGVRWWRTLRFGAFLKASAAFLLGTALHTGIASLWAFIGVVTIAALPGTLLTYRVRPVVNLCKSVALLGLAGIFVLSTGWGMGYLFAVMRRGLAGHLQGYARGGAAYLPDLVPQNMVDLIWQTPVRVFYFLFGPFPWHFRGGYELMGMLDGFAYLVVSGAIVGRLRVIWRRKALRWIMLMSLIGITVFALGTSNFGGAIRHRAKFAPLLLSLLPALSCKHMASWRVDEFRGNNETQDPHRDHGTSSCRGREASGSLGHSFEEARLGRAGRIVDSAQGL